MIQVIIEKYLMKNFLLSSEKIDKSGG